VLMDTSLFFLGEWQVNPSTNTLRCGELIKQLEPKAMDVLLLLCGQQGQVLSADDIATQCWGMDIGDNPVHKAITQLRKALNDKPSTPTYIETIRKRGYHIIAKLDFPLDDDLKAVQSHWQGASPFPGLVAFEAKDAQVFFGRNTQILTLLERLSNQVSAQHTFCLILGPSGTGKSSLVNAGLLPTLTSSNGYNGIGVISHTSIDFADISLERLFIDLASAMLDWDVNDQPVFAGMSAESLAEQLQGDSTTMIEQCIQSLKQTDKRYSKPQFLLFIDRLEVLLSSPVFSNDTRGAFLDLIQKLATSGAIMVLSACRNDFYPLVVNHPSLMANKSNGGHFDLLAPTRAELMQMIRLPAKAANLTWSVDANSATPLDQMLCAEAANNPDALPMLQYTLQELYLQRSEADELQVSVYTSLGGIEGAIGKKAEEIYQQLPEEHQPQLAAVLSHLVTLSPDGETITSRTARWSELSQASETSFVQAMVNSRLFVSHLQNNEPCFSLAHEALLRRWLRASEWISTHKDSLVIKSRLQQSTENWLSENKSSAYLLPQGKPLEEALSLQNMPVFTLDSNELALINTSQQKVKRKRWLRRSTFALLCLLTLTAILMSVKSQQAEGLALQKRLEAESLLGFMVGEFADKLRSVKRMDLLDGISNKALEYFSHQEDDYDDSSLFILSDSSLNFKARFQHALTLGAMGEVAYSRAKADEAEQAFIAAKVILDKLYVEQADNLELLKTLGANAFWLGQLATDEAAFTEAKIFFGLYLEYSQAMVKHYSDDKVAQLELSYAYLAMGSVNTKLQHPSAAKIAFEKALDIQYDLAKRLTKDDISHANTANTLEWLAETEEQLGDLQQAKQTRQKVQTIIAALLTRHFDNGDLLETQAYSYFNHANNLYYLTDYLAAHQAILSSITHFKAMLGQDPSNKLWRLQLLSAKAFQQYLAKIGHIEPSISLTSLEDFKIILKGAETSSSLIAMVIKNYQISEQWNTAQHAIKLAIPKIEKLLANHPKNFKLSSSLANIYLTQAKQVSINKVNDHNKEKFDACQQAILIIQPIISTSSSYELLLPYVQAHDCLGKLMEVHSYVDKLAKMQISNYQF
jgi:DNA-binding winged helix-turn-helix (wHTH) protein/energy-coupling factor transporter ATP-binding protein EcfA2